MLLRAGDDERSKDQRLFLEDQICLIRYLDPWSSHWRYISNPNPTLHWHLKKYVTVYILFLAMRKALIPALLVCVIDAYPSYATGEPTLTSLKPTLPKLPTGNLVLDLAINVIGGFVYDSLKTEVLKIFPALGPADPINAALFKASALKTAVISVATSGYVSPNKAVNILSSEVCSRAHPDRVTEQGCKDINANDNNLTILRAPYDIIAKAESRTSAGLVVDDAIASSPFPSISTGKGALTGEYLFSATAALAFIGDWGDGPGEFEFSPINFNIKPARLPHDPKFHLTPKTTNIDSDSIDDLVTSPGDSIIVSLVLDRSREEYDSNGIDSVTFGLNYDSTEIAFSNLCTLSSCTVRLPQPIYGGMSPVVIGSFDLGVLASVNDGVADFGISFINYEDEQSQSYNYSIQSLESQFEVQEVPAPPAVLGLVGFFKYSRKLRRRLKQTS